MRNIVFILLMFLIVIGCSESENQMMLTGSVKGLKKGTLLLQKFDDTLLVSVDSVVVDGDAAFSFSTEVSSPEMYYLYLRLKNGTLLDNRIPFFAEPSEINIQTSLKKFGNDVVITGSENQKLLEEYKSLMHRYTNKNLELIEAKLTALQNGNDSLVTALGQEQNKVRASKYLAIVNYASNHNNHEIAPYLILSEVYDANIKYLDTVYKVLSPNIKESKYGKELATFIKARKDQKE